MACPHMGSERADESMCPHMSSVNGSGAENAGEKDSLSSHPQKLEDIPQPPQHLFGILGNLPDVDPSFPFKEIWRLQRIYGPIMKLNLDKDRIFVGSQELVNEICDQERFEKAHLNILEEIRAALKDGLFTAYNDEVNWGKAHRMLVPTFGPIGIRKMWSGMQDIASQMVLKWDRLGHEHVIDSSDDLTRLAFDTIGLCAFSYRFNQFYSQDTHPFARQMASVLWESGRKANRPHIIQPLYRSAEQQRQANVAAMHSLCDEIVAERKSNPQPDNPDLLNVMLNSVDRETGEGLSAENIRYQLATFLVAGHETTSSTLSFCYYNLIKHPEKLFKAQKQVDEVVGDSVLTLEHVPKLDYIDACIKETLRINSPINGSTRWSKEDRVIGGKYLIPAGTTITWVNQILHKDPKVWGDDADEFKPERFLNGGFQRLPPNSWKPFGTGARACIGRAFAEQEMIMNVAMVLQRFQLEFADPSYDLKLKATLTIKPTEFKMKVRRRPGKSPWVGIPGGVQQREEQRKAHVPAVQTDPSGSKRPLQIYFGGNTGTCEALAQSLQATAKTHGFDATISDLDTLTENIPDSPVVIVTSSYEGLPPDNAKKFVAWLEHLQAGEKPLKQLQCAIFGVGNSDWASTFHRIPKLVHELTEKNGATSIVGPGFVNVKEDLTGSFEEWADQLLRSLSGGGPLSQEMKPTIEVSIQQNTSQPQTDLNYGTVLVNRELADTSVGPAKRHLEIRLPDSVAYQAGDYLVVQPHNHPDAVQRVLSQFHLNSSDLIQITNSAKAHLPKEPTSIGTFLATTVDLSTPITKRQLELISSHVPAARSDETSSIPSQHQTLASKRFSPLDVMQQFNIEIPLTAYIDMLPPLAPRQYSISSSALSNPHTVSLTIDVHEHPALSGKGTHYGVASNYLASRVAGDRIACFIRATNVGFRLPPPEKQTPLILIAAGTGIAPMRAFLQERAAISEAGTQDLGPAVLYFGCRDEEKDFIYRDQLREWERMGIVKVRCAFSRKGANEGVDPDTGKPKPHGYVPDVMWENHDEIADMFRDGGKIFLCGSAARLGASTAEMCKKIYRARLDKTAEEAEEWLKSVRTERYISDVY